MHISSTISLAVPGRHIALILTSLLLTAITASAQTVICPAGQPDWMIGHWEQESERSLVQEIWIRDTDTRTLGFGRIINRSTGRVVSHELLRLVRRADSVRYEAKPDANPDWTVFEPTRCSGSEFVVENPAHDFPTRIAYQRAGPDSMSVHVTGPDGNGFWLHYGRKGLIDP